MNTKKIIFWIAIVLIVVSVVIYAKFAPVWVSLTNIAIGGVSIVLGWIAHILYEKYIKK